jgi:hypothetical protein
VSVRAEIIWTSLTLQIPQSRSARASLIWFLVGRHADWAGYAAVDAVCDYYTNLSKKTVRAQVLPGYLIDQLPRKLPICAFAPPLTLQVRRQRLVKTLPSSKPTSNPSSSPASPTGSTASLWRTFRASAPLNR